MGHMLEAIPENAESIPGHADGFMRKLALDATETLGDVDTVGHLSIVRDVTRDEIRAYVSETGDVFVSDAARSGVVAGDYAIVTDSQGFVYGYYLPDAGMADETLANGERIDLAFDAE